MILSILTTLRSIRFLPRGFRGLRALYPYDILLLTVYSAFHFTFLFFLHTI